MQNRYRNTIAGFAGLGVLIAVILAPTPYHAQTQARPAQPYRAPRTKDGKPDLNGIWQAMNEANWDLEAHSSGPAPLLTLGALGAVPPGLGIVEGGSIPYKPEALAQRKKNFDNRLKDDPEVKCFMPGVPRAMYMPFPFQIIQ